MAASSAVDTTPNAGRFGCALLSRRILRAERMFASVMVPAFVMVLAAPTVFHVLKMVWSTYSASLAMLSVT